VIVIVDMSPSIGTPPRFIQPPSINDTRLIIPSLTQNINNKWDSISLSDGIHFFLYRNFYSTNDFRSSDW
jgi:hypothetical protein